jgi:integrase/recombinase XerD
MPSNLFRRGRTYYARFAIDGEIRRVSLQTNDVKEAKARLKGLLDERERIKREGFGLKEVLTWEDACERYQIGVLNSGGVKPMTAKRYMVSLRQVGEHFEGMALTSITLSTVSGFVSARQKLLATNATIRRDLTSISRVMAFAKSQGLVKSNVVEEYDRTFLAEQRDPISAPDDVVIEEAARLAEAAGKPDLGAVIRFLRATGMRTGEALRARGSHLNGLLLTIPETKNGRVRTIEIPPNVAPARTGLLFPDLPADPASLAGLWNRVRQPLDQEKRFRLHDLRHAYAISQIRAGKDIYDLSHHLGHSSVKVTEIYLGYAAGGRSQARTSR